MFILTKADMKAIAQALHSAGTSAGRMVSVARQKELSQLFAVEAELMDEKLVQQVGLTTPHRV